jgi:hypothetical protein
MSQLFEGDYRGDIRTSMVGESKEGSVGWKVGVLLNQWKDGNDWVDIEPVMFTDVLWIVSKEGNINVKKCESISEATGWDKNDPTWLDTTVGMPIQVSLKNSTWKGQTRLGIEWVNPYESAGGGGLAPLDKKNAVALTRQFRAQFGGRPVGGSPPTKPSAQAEPVEQAQAKPSAKPSTKPSAKPTSKPQPTQPAVTPPNGDEAYNVFLSWCRTGLSEKVVNAEWFRILGLIYPGADYDTMTDYSEMVEKGLGMMQAKYKNEMPANPVSDQSTFKPDDIPF